jgi:hypothetical protein
LSARRHDGSEFPVEISLSALQTPEGPIVLAAMHRSSAPVEKPFSETELLDAVRGVLDNGR